MKLDWDEFGARWGIPAVIALLGIAARAVMSTERTTLLGLAKNVVVGLFVGATMNLWLADAALLTDGARGAVVGVSAVVAEDVLTLVLRLARRARENPTQLVDWLLAAFTRLPPVQRKRDGE